MNAAHWPEHSRLPNTAAIPHPSFTDRFRGRIVQMTNDVSDEVAAEAVQVATCLLEYVSCRLSSFERCSPQTA